MYLAKCTTYNERSKEHYTIERQERRKNTVSAQRGARTTHVLNVDGLVVELERKRVKNVNLRLRSDGSVHVSAPYGVPETEIERFIRSKSAWIAERQNRMRSRQAARPSQWTDGETFLFWGRQLSLIIRPASSSREESVIPSGDNLIISVARRWMDDSDSSCAHRARLVERWVREQLEAACAPHFSRYEKLLGVHASQVRFRKMKSRWGSCNTKTHVITLNTELIHYPERCLESVVVHELCHLLEPSHNARFHTIMARAYPQWREARSILNRGL